MGCLRTTKSIFEVHDLLAVRGDCNRQNIKPKFSKIFIFNHVIRCRCSNVLPFFPIYCRFGWCKSRCTSTFDFNKNQHIVLFTDYVNFLMTTSPIAMQYFYPMPHQPISRLNFTPFANLPFGNVISDKSLRFHYSVYHNFKIEANSSK